MEENLFRHIVKGIAVILCVLFFVMPLVKCSQDSSINATGWEIFTGTGKLFEDKDDTYNGYPFVLMLLLIPVILLVIGINKGTCSVLRNISIIGFFAQCIFMIVTQMKLKNSDLKGPVELTSLNWLVLILHCIVIALMQYCINIVKRLPAPAAKSSED